MTAATLGLGIISCAYLAEIYRSGVAVGAGQWEASAALGMPRRTVLTRIVGPQMGRISVPAAATYAIGLLTDFSVAYAIGPPTTCTGLAANPGSPLTSSDR